MAKHQAREHVHDPSSHGSSGGASNCKLEGAPGLFKRGSFWEIFSGESNLSRAMSKAGFSTLGPIDIINGDHHDLTRRATQDAVKEIVFREGVSYIHLSTPCTAFSRARHNIKNQKRGRQKERVACELAFFSAESVLNLFEHVMPGV